MVPASGRWQLSAIRDGSGVRHRQWSGELVALLTTERLAVALPATVGGNVTVKVALRPAATAKGRANAEACSGDIGLRNSHGIAPGVGEGDCFGGTAAHSDAAKVEAGWADAERGGGRQGGLRGIRVNALDAARGDGGGHVEICLTCLDGGVRICRSCYQGGV